MRSLLLSLLLLIVYNNWPAVKTHQPLPRATASAAQIPNSEFTMAKYAFAWANIVVLVLSVSAFPDGAPGSTCKKHRPDHGATSQPLSTLPFIIKASAEEYKPGDAVAVRITGKPGYYFKGFFLQAQDDNGKWIGTFEQTPFSVSHPECSMITHHDNEQKEEVTLIWHPPSDGPAEGGKVHFLASVLKSYKQYWVDAPAAVAA